MSCRTRARPIAVLILIVGSLAAPAAIGGEPTRESVHQAMDVIYVHGVTEEIAHDTVGIDGLPYLLELLADPDHDRRDNVVAFIGYLGDDVSTQHLLDFLAAPPRSSAIPEEDRAMLLAPVALGQIAASGYPQALDALLRFTASDGDETLHGDLFEMALRGLAYAGGETARRRLETLSVRDVETANEALALFDALRRADGSQIPEPGDPPVGFEPAADLDFTSRAHDTVLDFANHAALTNDVTDARADAILARATILAGRDDYSDDIACCVSFHRRSSGRSFGTVGDGLDVVGSQTEMNQVLANNVARIKVVRQINWCGGAGTNIIGCAEQPGNGMVVVRLSNVNTEGILWLHEYGHNVGLGHVGQSRRIMHGQLTGANDGLVQSECSAYHFPPGPAQIVPSDVGLCADGDDDAVHDAADNCPAAANTDQQDSDGDGIGDVCASPDVDGDGILNEDDNCVNNANPGQEDNDQDGLGDLCDVDDDNDSILDVTDNCPFVANVTQSDGDADGLGDACDSCHDVDGDGYGSPGDVSCSRGSATDCDDMQSTVHPNAPELCDEQDNDCDLGVDDALCQDFDVNGDQIVDGVELAWLGRSFTACGSGLWWMPVDYTGDGCIAGDDLAILSVVWRCQGPGPICPEGE